MIVNKEIIEQVETLLSEGKQIPREINFLYKNIPGTLKNTVLLEMDSETMNKNYLYSTDICLYVSDMLNIELTELEIDFLTSSVLKDNTTHDGFKKITNLLNTDVRKDVINMYMLYTAMFHGKSNIFLGFPQSKSKEYRDLYLSIPYMYKQPLIMFGKEIYFVNGGRITSGTNSIGSNYDGYALNNSCTYSNIIYDEILPTLHAYKRRKVIITSTPNGLNTFYQKYIDQNS